MNTKSEASPILDTNGRPARPLETMIEPAQPENVVPMPEQQLDRTGKILQKGDRRAIAILYETKLDGPRVNLLLARIYVAMENAEREVMALGTKDVDRILERFKDSRPAADGEAS